MESSEEEDDDVSGDEEDDKPKLKRSRLSRGSRPTKTRDTESPTPGQSRLKRKQSVSEGNPPPKKSKPSGGPNDDPTRKYCLGKLQEIFSKIFLTFPYFPPEDSVKIEGEGEGDNGPEPNAPRLVSDKGFAKTTAQLTEEDKARLEEKASVYATQVEVAVFDAHAEPDKAGILSASGKYK